MVIPDTYESASSAEHALGAARRGARCRMLEHEFGAFPGKHAATALPPARSCLLSGNGSLAYEGLFYSSPGWTRTNNPPVNSRMLCQLSYRGTR